MITHLDNNRGACLLFGEDIFRVFSRCGQLINETKNDENHSIGPSQGSEWPVDSPEMAEKHIWPFDLRSLNRLSELFSFCLCLCVCVCVRTFAHVRPWRYSEFQFAAVPRKFAYIIDFFHQLCEAFLRGIICMRQSRYVSV